MSESTTMKTATTKSDEEPVIISENGLNSVVSEIHPLKESSDLLKTDEEEEDTEKTILSLSLSASAPEFIPLQVSPSCSSELALTGIGEEEESTCLNVDAKKNVDEGWVTVDKRKQLKMAPPVYGGGQNLVPDLNFFSHPSGFFDQALPMGPPFLPPQNIHFVRSAPHMVTRPPLRPHPPSGIYVPRPGDLGLWIPPGMRKPNPNFVRLGGPKRGQNFRGNSRNFPVRKRPPRNFERKAQCYRCQATREEVQKCIDVDHTVLVLMRGVPGSGKSTLAKAIKGDGGEIFSTDEFFTNRDGRYNWSPAELDEAHRWNFQRAAQAMEGGITPVIIDNTNIRIYEMKRYALSAVQLGYEIYCLEPETAWKFKANQCAKRTLHQVPVSTIEKMLDFYEHVVTLEMLTRRKPAAPKAKSNLSGLSNSSEKPSASEVNNAESSTSIDNQVKNELIINQSIDNRLRDESLEGNDNSSYVKSKLVSRDDYEGKNEECQTIVESNNSDRKSITDWRLEEPDHEAWGVKVETAAPPGGGAEHSEDTLTAAESKIKKETSQPKAQRKNAKARRCQMEQNTAEKEEETVILETQSDRERENSASPLRKQRTNKVSRRHKSQQLSLIGVRPKDEAVPWALPDFLQGGVKSGVEEHEEPGRVRGLRKSASDFTLLPYDKLPRVTVECRSIASDVTEQSLLLESGHSRLKNTEEHLDGIENYGNRISSEETMAIDRLASDCVRRKANGSQTEALKPIEGLKSLVEMFPDLALDDLEHIIESCDGDLTEASHVLLDAQFTFVMPGRRGKEKSPTPRNKDSGLGNSAVDVSSSVPSSPEKSTTSLLKTFDGGLLQKESENEESGSFCCMDLDPAFAEEIQEMYGMGTENKEDNIPASLLHPRLLRVNLPICLAKEIHKYWMQTLPESRALIEESADASFQQSEVNYPYWDHEFPDYTDENSTDADQTTTMDNFGVFYSMEEDERTAIALQSVEDAEYARMLYEEEEKIHGQHLTVSAPNSFATKLTKDKLKEMFPSVDPTALEDIFEAHGCKLDPTVESIQCAFGIPIQKPRGVVKMTQTLNQNEEEIFLSDNNSDFESIPTSTAALTYNELRKEAQHHGQKRKECFARARESHNKNQAPVAHHYSTQGRHHNEKIKEANRRAEEIILQHRRRTNPENTLDLHGLHVPEAVRAMSQKLRENDRPLPQRSMGPGRQIKVITGQGKHSSRGPKIKPAIVGYLTQHQYRYEEISGGVLNVFCK